MAHLPSKVPLLLSYAALATNKAASFVSILFLCGQYNFKGELSGERGGGRERGREREWGGKAICHRKQRSARGQDHILAEWLLLVVRYCLAELRGAKGPPSFLPSPLTLCPPFLGQKVVLFANGHRMGPSQSRNLSRFELDRI